MPYVFPVEMQDGTAYRVTRLLAKAASNTKTAKSDKAGLGYLTYSLSLAPASISGFNLCSSSSHGCRVGCLFTSGYANVNPRTVQPARIAKARMLRMHAEEFKSRLFNEMRAAKRRADKLGLKLAVRLNVISDVIWEKECPQLFRAFPDVQFYDYTKHKVRMFKYVDGELPSNLHLTFSRSETNENVCLDILRSGGNVTVVFDTKYHQDKLQSLPKSWRGFKVIDGDVTDARFLDNRAKPGKVGYVVGLRAKGKAKKDDSGFVVKTRIRKAVSK